MRRWTAVLALLLTAVAGQAMAQGTTATRPPFRLDQLTTQPARTFPCNPTGATGSLQSCTFASYFTFAGATLGVDLASFFATRTISTVSCLTGGGDLSVNRTLSIQGHCIDPTLLAFAPAHTLLGNNGSGAGELLHLSAAQATAELAAFVGDVGGGGVKGLVPAPAAGDAAAGKVLGAGGGWVVGGGSNYNPASVAITGGSISGTAISCLAPSNSGDCATKGYVDGIAAGFKSRMQVLAATCATGEVLCSVPGLPNSPVYANGTGGIGATLTATTNGAFVLDEQALVHNGRYLVKDASKYA